LSRGKVDHAVVTLAEEIGAGLIVLGSRGHGGIRRALMGSVSDAVVRHAHCPVLVVRELSEKSVVVDSPKRLSY
jgi:nucleotide-binding universal stress UspA family protein